MLCLATLGGCSLPIGMDRGPAPGSVAGNDDLTIVAGHFEARSLGASAGKIVGQVVEAGGVRLRIAASRPDPDDPTGEVVLYRFVRVDGASAAFCPGDGWGFPVAGSWSAGAHLHAPGQIVIACVGTAEARCVDLGYRPWRHAANGADLWDYHQACVRALRADYCGTGRDRAGRSEHVALYDKLAIHPLRQADGMSFEAAWGVQGAACVNHIRAPSRMTLRDLRTECANLPRAHLGNSCDEREPALIFTKSPLQ